MSADAKVVQVTVFREKLAEFLREAESGAEFIVVSRNRPVARLMPPELKERRPVGLMRGRIWMAPDWDAPDDELIAAMEGRDDEP